MLTLFEKNNCDVIIGSRSIPGSEIKIRQPYFRILMGRIFNLFVRLLFFSGFPDTQCGFKCFTKKAAKEIFPLLRINHFAFDVEIFVVARAKGFRIEQVPVVWVNSAKSRVSPFKDAARMFFDLIRIKHNEINRLYK